MEKEKEENRKRSKITRVLAIVVIILLLLALTVCLIIIFTHRHAMTYYSAAEATCTTDGNAEYWYCAGCNSYFEDENGRIYSHILDPSTGYPADTDLLSATIIGKEGKMCDALSTALFVMGAEGAEKYWRENGGFDMLLVTDQNEIILTQGVAERFILAEGREETVRVIAP